MNNRLYEYMRLGKEEDEKIYKEELFDTKKIVKLTDKDIAKFNAQNSKNDANKKYKKNQIEQDNQEEQTSYMDDYNNGYYLDNNSDISQNSYGQDDNGQYSLNMDQYVDNYANRKNVDRVSQPVDNAQKESKSVTDEDEEHAYKHAVERVRHYNNNIIKNPEKQTTGNTAESLIYHYRSPFRNRKNAGSIKEKIESKPLDFNGMDGNTQLMGLIAETVSNSLLPWLHKEIALVTDYNYSYNAFNIASAKLGAALTSGTVLGIKGFNVGDPYKEEIIPKLKAIGKSAYLIGYVNTLVAKEDGYYGFNTEVTGIKRTLKSDGTVLKNKNILITGSDNIINSIILAACELEARNIFVISSDREKINKAAVRISAAYGNTAIHILEPGDDYMYAINQHTTIQNFKLVAFYTGADMPDDIDLYERIDVGYDISFDVNNTQFTNRVLESGGAADNGLKMYIYKALSAYELWTGKKATDEMAEYINKKLKKKLYK